jgi:hypothetical protein
LKFAEKRLLKARERVGEGEVKEAEELVEEYERKVSKSLEMVERAEILGRNVTKVNELIASATSAHLEVLQEVYEKVPDEAKPAIGKALNVSQRGHEEASEALRRAPVPPPLPPQAERARAGRQGDGDRERGPPERPTVPPEPTPAPTTPAPPTKPTNVSAPTMTPPVQTPPVPTPAPQQPTTTPTTQEPQQTQPSERGP